MSGNDWVLMWSHSRNEVAAKPLNEVLSAGRVAYRDNEPSDWTPLHVGSRDTMATAAQFCQPTLMARQPVAVAALADGFADTLASVQTKAL